MRNIAKILLSILVLIIATTSAGAMPQSGIPDNGWIANDDWASFPQSQVWEKQLPANIVSGPVFVGSRM
ncbi:MAG TPA: hypothetical protein PLC49_07020, partial [Caldisericia bacterium]|nr:hypothetical protein [Caldisericia bacterium]